MAYISKFKTDTAYSNEDINLILSAITSKGVLPSSPNDILSAVAAPGVTLSDSRCAVSWENEDKTSIVIGSGTVIMSDGSYIVISNETLPVEGEEKHYVYIYSDLILQNIPICKTTLPQNGRDYVVLAEVENGKILDRRTLALSKIADFGRRSTIKTTLSFTVADRKISAGEDLCSVNIGNGYSGFTVYNNQNTFVGIFDLEAMEYEKKFTSSSKHIRSGTNYIETPTALNRLYVRFANGVLSFYSDRDLWSNPEVTYSLYLTIF